MFEKVIPLILLQDYCYLLTDTLKNCSQNGITKVIILNSAKEQSKEEVKNICDSFKLALHYLEYDFTNYSDTRNKLLNYANSIYNEDSQVAFLIIDPGNLIEIIDKDKAESCINNVISKRYIYYILQKWTFYSVDKDTYKINEHSTKWYLPTLFLPKENVKYEGYAHEYLCTNRYINTTDSIIQCRNIPDFDYLDETNKKIENGEIVCKDVINYVKSFNKRCKEILRLDEFHSSTI